MWILHGLNPPGPNFPDKVLFIPHLILKQGKACADLMDLVGIAAPGSGEAQFLHGPADLGDGLFIVIRVEKLNPIQVQLVDAVPCAIITVSPEARPLVGMGCDQNPPHPVDSLHKSLGGKIRSQAFFHPVYQKLPLHPVLGAVGLDFLGID